MNIIWKIKTFENLSPYRIVSNSEIEDQRLHA